MEQAIPFVNSFCLAGRGASPLVSPASNTPAMASTPSYLTVSSAATPSTSATSVATSLLSTTATASTLSPQTSLAQREVAAKTVGDWPLVAMSGELPPDPGTPRLGDRAEIAFPADGGVEQPVPDDDDDQDAYVVRVPYMTSPADGRQLETAPESGGLQQASR